MTLSRYLVGLVSMVAIIGPLLFASRTLRKRFLLDWLGVPAALAQIVMVLAMLLVTAQLLGAVGAFHILNLTLASACWGIISWLLFRSSMPAIPKSSALPKGASRAERLEILVTIGAISLVSGAWIPFVGSSLGRGMPNVDTLWYHMPFAARFAQQGWVTKLHFTDFQPLHTFFPANSELLHAIGIIVFRNDVLSPLINLGFFSLTLIAAWCIGSTYSAGPSTTVSALLLLSSPTVLATQPGDATNDIVGVSLLLSAIAFLVAARGKQGTLTLAGIAAGLALGTKVSLGIPIAALTLGIIVITPRTARKFAALTWSLYLLAGAGIWYIRNTVRTGNPVPWLHLGIGSFSLHSIDLPYSTPFMTSIAHYATDAKVWWTWFRPYLNDAFGPGWMVLLLTATLGMTLSAATGRTSLERMLGMVGLVSAVGYLLTPTTAGGPEGSPTFFPFQIRHSLPGLMIGAVLFPTLPLWTSRHRRWLFVGLMMLLLVTLAAPTLGVGIHDRLAILISVGVAAAFLTHTLRRHITLPRSFSALMLAALLATSANAGWRIQRDYLQHRYRNWSSGLGNAYEWARSIKNSRVAIVGLQVQYPLYGLDLSNWVQYVGRQGPQGAFSPINNCLEWRKALNAGKYEYVVTAPLVYPLAPSVNEPSEASWTRTDPAAVEILRDGPSSVFHLKRKLDPTGCTSPSIQPGAIQGHASFS